MASRKYASKLMEGLATELAAGLLRLRKGYIDTAETLAMTVDPAGEYPYDFIVYRLTGFRHRRPGSPAEPISGKDLRGDLLRLMLQICDSFKLRSTDYDEEVLDIPSLTRRFKVSAKTIQRWRRRGLAARRLVFPGGKRRVAFLPSSVEWFIRDRRKSIMRSARFSQMDEDERRMIIRRARRMASMTPSSLTDVARRIAARTGRALETVRYTIRKHDRENPDKAIFSGVSTPLNDRERIVIYHSFLRGSPVPKLAKQYHRTRSSIYRIINETRARQLLDRPIWYVYNPQFDLPNADEIIFTETPDPDEDKHRKSAKAPSGLPVYLRSLYEVPLLGSSGEKDLFRKYNYLKYKTDKLKKRIDLKRIRTGQLREIEQQLLQANIIKNKIVRANLRLVVSIAKKHVGSGPQTLFELISDGNVSLMKAVEKFDYSRGNKFSTYASWAIMRNFARSVPKERRWLDHFATGIDDILDMAASLRIYDQEGINPSELRESIDVVLAQLTPRERKIITDHYGLDENSGAKTLDQLSKSFGLSKERVRQIEIQAMDKLRKILHPQKSDLMA